MNELATINTNVDSYRASTEAAELCKEIVVATSSKIQGRNYVSVEGWQAIARAHGCAVGATNVERIEGGVRAIGEVRDMMTGMVIATGEGFVGEDEETWFGGKNRWGKELPKRNDYAIRAMAQTRAMSRACRSAFAHVVVMMNAGLATTPAEEVPHDGFDGIVDAKPKEQPRKEPEVATRMADDNQRDLISQMVGPAGTSIQAIVEGYKVSDLRELTFDQAKATIVALEKRGAKASTDILDDEIPY